MKVIEAYYDKNRDFWSDVPTEGGEQRFIFDHPVKGLIDIDEGTRLLLDEGGWKRVFMPFNMSLEPEKMIDQLDTSALKRIIKGAVNGLS